MKKLVYLSMLILLVSCSAARPVAVVAPAAPLLRAPLPRTQVVIAPSRIPRTKVVIVPQRGRNFRAPMVKPRVGVRGVII